MVPPPQLAEFAALPLYDAVGNLTSLHFTAKFKVLSPQPDGRTFQPVIRSVEFDLVQQAGRTVILGGMLVEYGEIAEDVVNLCLAIYKLQNPDPLPTNPAPKLLPRRKDLREAAKK